MSLITTVVGCVGFDWGREQLIFEEAARRASEAIGRKIKVKPCNEGVALLVAVELQFVGIRLGKPAELVTLAGASDSKITAVCKAIRRVVAKADLKATAV